MKLFHFGNRPIGPDHPCFIIAEAGVNHNGRVSAACDLITAARDAGADAIKFQTFRTEKLVARGAEMADYQKANTGLQGDQIDLLKQLEIDEPGFEEIFAFARSLKMPIFSTPDEEESADFLARLKVLAFKIGSGEINNIPFLSFLAEKGLPIILSTGMSDMAETARAIEVLTAGKCVELALLHCVSAYPAPFDSLNLRAMAVLRTCFDVPVGFSDHTLGTEAAVAAVALGASIIEKHFTLDTRLPGPDHLCSLDPEHFSAMVGQIRNIEQALGPGQKKAAPIEIGTRALVRKGLVASRNLPAGTVLTHSDISIKRVSGNAAPPADLENMVGLRLVRPASIDAPLNWTHFKQNAGDP